MDGNSSDEIRERAYRIWDAEGRPEGKEKEHWERAERELSSEANASGSSSAGSDVLETPVPKKRRTAAAKKPTAAKKPAAPRKPAARKTKKEDA